jgi:hypothetical protein
VECKFRDREITVKEKELSRSRWNSPLVLAIIAATVAALGSVFVAWWNGYEGERLESSRAESTRILEMIKTGNNADRAAENLQFLLDAGLIEDKERSAAIRYFLSTRKPGSGPSLPSAAGGSGPIGSAPVGSGPIGSGPQSR